MEDRKTGTTEREIATGKGQKGKKEDGRPLSTGIVPPFTRGGREVKISNGFEPPNQNPYAQTQKRMRYGHAGKSVWEEVPSLEVRIPAN